MGSFEEMEASVSNGGARDVCDVLGYEHITNTLDKLDEDELTVKNLQSGGQRG